MKNFLSKLTQDDVSENQVLRSRVATAEGSKKPLFQKLVSIKNLMALKFKHNSRSIFKKTSTVLSE